MSDSDRMQMLGNLQASLTASQQKITELEKRARVTHDYAKLADKVHKPRKTVQMVGASTSASHATGSPQLAGGALSEGHSDPGNGMITPPNPFPPNYFAGAHTMPHKHSKPESGIQDLRA